MIYQNQKLPQVLSIKQLLYSNMQTITKFYVGLVFYCLPSYGLAFPKLMGMLIDSVNKSYSDANNIALMLIDSFYAIHFFLLDYPYLSILQNTL
jgi:hypothetical protein